MATQIIPPGYSKVTFTFTLTGSTRFFQTSIEVQNLLADGAPATLLTTVRNAFTTSGGPFLPGNMLIGYVLTEVKILMVTLGGVMLTATNATPVIGTRVGAPLPVNTSVIIRKTVAQAGKPYRGRMLIPPFYFTEVQVDPVGILDPTTLTASQLTWNNAYTAITPSNTIVLLHSNPAIPPTTVTALTVNNKIGTIGKRLRG